MSLVVWDDSYCTGIKTFDEQHQVLFGLIDNLLAGVAENREHETVSNTLDALLEYTKDHFAAEEKEMLAHAYPDYEEHKKEHQKLLNNVVAYYVKFRADDTLSTADLVRFLIDWLQNHIHEMDKKYAPHLAPKV